MRKDAYAIFSVLALVPPNSGPESFHANSRSREKTAVARVKFWLLCNLPKALVIRTKGKYTKGVPWAGFFHLANEERTSDLAYERE